MTIIRVEYDGVKYDLDVLEETPIRVDISAIENNEIGEIFGAASQQFTLPGSKKNNRFFKHAYKVGVTGIPGLGESVPCWVISKSDTLIEGSLFLDEVVKTANGGINYEVTIVNNVVTFNESIKTVAVKDLNWDSYDHSFSTANITGSWTNNLFSGDIYYPLIDMGTDGSETTGSLPNVAIDNADTASIGYINNSASPMQVRQFTPAIRVSTVLDKIFEQGEFTWSSSLESTFDSLYILPKQTEDLSVRGSGFSAFTFAASSSIDFLFTEADGYEPVPTNVEVFDNGGGWSGPGDYKFVVPRVGTYAFRYQLIVETSPEDPSARYDIRIRNLTNSTNISAVNVSPPDVISVFSLDTGPVNLFQNDEVQLQIRYDQVGGQGQLDSYVISGSNFTAYDSPLNYETGIIKIGEQFEPQTKCIDIIRGLVQKLNLVIEPVYTENRTLKIETYDTWATSGKKVDWTQKIQQADRISLRSPLSSQQKTLIFQDNKDNDKLSKQVIDNAEGFQWGTEVVDSISDVPQGEKNLGSYFAPVVLERLDGGDENNIIPQLYKTDNSQIGKKTFKFKPRLGYKVNSTLSRVSYIGNSSEPFQDYATISNYNTIPVVSGSTKNLHFNESFYTPTFSTTATGSITSYDIYWNNYVSNLYNEDTKILNAQIKFEPNELRDIELNQKIFVEDEVYRINKIRGFNVNFNDVVDLELISLSSQFSIPFIPNCDFDFSEVNTTTTTTTTVAPVIVYKIQRDSSLSSVSVQYVDVYGQTRSKTWSSSTPLYIAVSSITTTSNAVVTLLGYTTEPFYVTDTGSLSLFSAFTTTGSISETDFVHGYYLGYPGGTPEYFEIVGGGGSSTFNECMISGSLMIPSNSLTGLSVSYGFGSSCTTTQPTTTTTTTTTIAVDCYEWDLFCPSNAVGTYCEFTVPCCDGTTVQTQIPLDSNLTVCVLSGSSVTVDSVSGVAEIISPLSPCTSSCGDITTTTTTTTTQPTTTTTTTTTSPTTTTTTTTTAPTTTTTTSTTTTSTTTTSTTTTSTSTTTSTTTTTTGPTTTTTTSTTVAPTKFVEITVNNNSGIYWSGSAFGYQARAFKSPGNVAGPYLYELVTGSNYVSDLKTYTGVGNVVCSLLFDNNVESWTSIQVTSSMYLDGVLTASFSEVVDSTEPTPQSGINNSNTNHNLFTSYSYEFEINPN